MGWSNLKKINKEEIERKAQGMFGKDIKNVPEDEKILASLKSFKQKHPGANKIIKRLLKKLKKKFPDKEFPDWEEL